MSAVDMSDAAMAYAEAGWEVFPLAGKVPAIGKRLGGNGVLDATTDPAQVAAWWGDEGRRLNAGPFANIGGRVPKGLIVVDIDPRHDGHLTLAHWESEHGRMRETLRSWSGRGDGGCHYWFRRPEHAISLAPLRKTGVDVKSSSGYVVLPPSIHPDSGSPYRWDDQSVPIAPTPRWFAEMLRPAPIVITTRRRYQVPMLGESVADWFTRSTSWPEILQPHGWHAVNELGTVWRHPAATHASSATISHDCLFVYSSNTAFEVTDPGTPNGYTRFRAYAILWHDGDLSAAAKEAMTMRSTGRVVLA